MAVLQIRLGKHALATTPQGRRSLAASRLFSITAVDSSGGSDAEATGALLSGPIRPSPLGPPRGADESNEILLDGDEKFHKYQGEVFCNRALNMKRVMAVGFDMDYTLAQYIPETFELLAHRGAVDKLVNFMVTPV